MHVVRPDGFDGRQRRVGEREYRRGRKIDLASAYRTLLGLRT